MGSSITGLSVDTSMWFPMPRTLTTTIPSEHSVYPNAARNFFKLFLLAQNHQQSSRHSSQPVPTPQPSQTHKHTQTSSLTTMTTNHTSDETMSTLLQAFEIVASLAAAAGQCTGRFRDEIDEKTLEKATLKTPMPYERQRKRCVTYQRRQPGHLRR